MMKRYEFGFECGGVCETEIVEYEDDVTEEQACSDCQDWMNGRINSWCIPVEEEK